MKHLLTFILVTCCIVAVSAQIRPENGLAPSEAPSYALRNATVYVSPDEVMNHATLIIKDGKITEVSSNPLMKIPKDAVEIDCKGKVILPSFIDLNSTMGMPEVKTPESKTRDGAVHWNYSIHPELDAASLYSFDGKGSDALVAKGFGFAVSRQDNGVAQGTGTLVATNETEAARMTAENIPSYFSFSRGASPQGYPSSQMGSIALLRQAFYDAKWYENNKEELNLSYEALLDQQEGTMIFKTRDDLELLRAAKIANEFGFEFVFLGSGEEYQSIPEIAGLSATIVLPLDYPEAYDVQNPYVARQIPLSDLKHWEMAPSNARILLENGVNICFTGEGVKAEDFWSNLRKTLAHGVSEEDVLKGLTTQPAKILGMSDALGTLEKGKWASFTIFDSNPLHGPAKILEAWSMGNREVKHVINDVSQVTGEYSISLEGKSYEIELTEQGGKLKGKLTYEIEEEETKRDTTTKLSADFFENNITFQFNIHNQDLDGSVSMRGKYNSRLHVFEGEALIPDGSWVKWSAIRSKKGENKKEDTPTITLADTTNYTWFPNMAYGFDSLPEQQPIIIKNATLWTNEADGILKNATIAIENGKITYVGTGNGPRNNKAIVIDAKGKHVTSGIIDEHSHIAISKGVNEGGQSISSEVSIGHVVNPQDINIYRQLAGGVTAAQLLHGSANPIGGQSALIKLKWGGTAEDMLIDDAPGFIKFALGENVKRSNWGSGDRFPQTRMGVEQVFYDGFHRAKAYEAEWSNYKKGGKNEPRVDLELEALVEILNEERFISCHSYVQSEINMLMHVTDSMGFKVNTFTHILEGYKVADKMVEHGAGGSTFSDWWAYKYEVNDAIPYNAALMHEQGVVVAINSDDAEMGRRLNQEAAKGVKYGGMSEEEAWKMVTLNPAKLLHLDENMGSLKVGKDADIVIWSDNPLSVRAKAEKTMIDGVILYDAEIDAEKRKSNQAEKARIISKMLADNEAGGKKKPFIKIKKGHYHCNTLGEEATLEENQH
ncbi:MAG: amidohydrolase family protein [bacterium]|nr:amidohydrolase family protein [bacterium]